MRRPQRLIAATVLAAIALALAGCSNGNFDPTDMMDWFDTKKKIPGERKPVFPEGVPGVEQGVPKDLYKGAQHQQDQAPVADVAPPPAPEPKSRRAASKSDARASAPRDAEPFPTPVDDPNAAPPKMKKPKRTRITAPPPDAEPAEQAPPQQAQPRQAAPQPPAQQQSSSPFPAPLPSGGFAR
jgi:hypothetical protein